MRFDRATIALVPGTTSNSIDLAFMFVGRHLKPVFGLWLLLGMPTGLLIYVYGSRYGTNLLEVLVLMFFVSSILGRMLIDGAAPSAFGEAFRLRHIVRKALTSSVVSQLKGIWRRCLCGIGLFLMLPLSLGWSMLGTLLLIPGTWMILRQGFHAEQNSLAYLDGDLHDRQTNELVKENMSSLCGRGCLITMSTCVLWFVLFWTVDVASRILIAFPVFSGRAADTLPAIDDYDLPGEYMADWFEACCLLVWDDPLVLTVIALTGLLAYIFGRLAWFFSYVDTRVRLDLWDMELQFQQDALRLEKSA